MPGIHGTRKKQVQPSRMNMQRYIEYVSTTHPYTAMPPAARATMIEQHRVYLEGKKKEHRSISYAWRDLFIGLHYSISNFTGSRAHALREHGPESPQSLFYAALLDLMYDIEERLGKMHKEAKGATPRQLMLAFNEHRAAKGLPLLAGWHDWRDWLPLFRTKVNHVYELLSHLALVRPRFAKLPDPFKPAPYPPSVERRMFYGVIECVRNGKVYTRMGIKPQNRGKAHDEHDDPDEDALATASADAGRLLSQDEQKID